MRPVKLEIDKLVGYTVVGSGEPRIKKLGSAKLGCKLSPSQIKREQTASSGKVTAAA
jgi:hypothetical protein